ncbi:MAG: cyclic nucleotide-binding domain-containing protein [Halobacteriovoraceae bacterium]|jgi:CRP/FNR family transcriptional regulator, cyclic AMP receptor protein|nr:cyclic nucleotide-binding domain-containing protein [Halobacteriovoraceae bacterium]MBT5094345.1 cyclic nucleotide-binding domain-containing protein [Halobacteriovoraceae bacterium]
MGGEVSGPLTLSMKKDELVCTAGDSECDLYIIHSGKLLVFVNEKSKITPLAFLGPGEYLGELSFFDGQSRSAHVVCVEDASLIKVPVTELNKQFPDWLITLAKSITTKLRKTGELIRVKGIRKQNVESMKALSIEEQTHYFQIIKDRL